MVLFLKTNIAYERILLQREFDKPFGRFSKDYEKKKTQISDLESQLKRIKTMPA